MPDLMLPVYDEWYIVIAYNNFFFFLTLELLLTQFGAEMADRRDLFKPFIVVL